MTNDEMIVEAAKLLGASIDDVRLDIWEDDPTSNYPAKWFRILFYNAIGPQWEIAAQSKRGWHAAIKDLQDKRKAASQ